MRWISTPQCHLHSPISPPHPSTSPPPHNHLSFTTPYPHITNDIPAQVYFKTLTEACVGNDENARNNALMTIKNDKALDPLLPHLMHFIAEGIRLNIMYQNLAVLIYLVRIVRSLVDNPHVNLDPYLHRILPALLSVVLCGNICLNPITDNHFALRKFAGKVVNSICER